MEKLTNHADTGVSEDVLLVLSSKVLVVNRLLGLGIDPSDVGLAGRLESAVKVLDVTHDPAHLDETLDGELALGLHLPSGPRTSPRTDFGKSSDDDDLVEVDESLKSVELLERLDRLERGEAELEVGSGGNRNLLVHALGLHAVNDAVIGRVVDGNGSSEVASELELSSDLGRDLGEVRKLVHASVEVGPNGLDLSDVEEERVHDWKRGGESTIDPSVMRIYVTQTRGAKKLLTTKNVERHLLGGEGTDSELLESLSNGVGSRHETSSSRPSDDGTGKAEVLAPRLGSPSVEEGLERDLGLGVKTIVTKETVVGREGKNNLGGSGDEVWKGSGG